MSCNVCASEKLSVSRGRPHAMGEPVAALTCHPKCGREPPESLGATAHNAGRKGGSGWAREETGKVT